MIRLTTLARRVAALVLAGSILAALFPASGGAHGPTPVLSSSLWGQSQSVGYRWRSGNVPPSRLQPAIHAAAIDSNDTRASKAAVFTSDSSAPSLIGYGLNATCGVNGIACFTRTAPTSFTMWFREQGHAFQWGSLRWCQMYETAPNGCFDVENIALDEFGHVQVLAHHVNYQDQSDYLDSVVQATSRTKPNTGWNVHAYGRCDVATLQREYDVLNSSAKYSTCLDLQAVMTLSASRTSVNYLGSSTLTATLKVTDADAYERLGGNLISSRRVVIQRRLVGSTTWTTVTTMTPGATAGTYTYTATSLTTTADWRAVFSKPSDEGLRGATSPTVRITVAPLCEAIATDDGSAPSEVTCQ